ncbi:hypothetical protein ACHAQK_007630 [Fusarium lateritium]
MPSPTHSYHIKALDRLFDQALKNTHSKNQVQVMEIIKNVQTDRDEVMIKCAMQSTVFHSTGDGTINPEKQLLLNLKDFAFPEVSNNWPSVPILIKFEAIAKALQDAQQEEKPRRKQSALLPSID